jgi:threonine/homoserine/homoserine lactone efflux protein
VNEVLRILLYGLVAATSPLALGATIVVLTSGRGRLNGTAFAIGVLVGQSLVIVLLLVLGSAWVPTDEGGHDVLRVVLDLGFGLALLAAAWHVRRAPLPHLRPSTPRTDAIRARLQRLSPVTAVGTGALLGIGGPKRLGITLLAATTVAASDPSQQEKLTLAAVYVLIATSLVWAPVLLYLVFDHRATDWLRDRQAWIRANQQPLIFWPSLVLGVLLVVDGIVQAASLH